MWNSSYPTRPDAKVLNGVSFFNRTQSGGCTCGSIRWWQIDGTALISRFYDVQRGEIKLDGLSISDLNMDWLREHVAVVRQEPILFATSILDNIRYGRLTATKEEIIAAAKAAMPMSLSLLFRKPMRRLWGKEGFDSVVDKSKESRLPAHLERSGDAHFRRSDIGFGC